MMRKSKLLRKTRETEISLSLNLDGTGKARVRTGIGFLDHLLQLFAAHSLMDLNLRARGDLVVDQHHTVEDIGIILGQALKKALGSREGIRRYGTAFVPMDESLARCVVDLSGRPYLVFSVKLSQRMTKDLEAEMVEEFFRALAANLGANLHLELLYGRNSHHQLEALFKAFAMAIRAACEKDPRRKGIPSSKGRL
jgi:imidazoleglycerol-phosphate dehydratase